MKIQRLSRLPLIFLLFVIVIAVCLLVLTVYGVYLAFSASIILGVIVLILEPSPLIIALVTLFLKPDLCQTIVKWLNIPF